MIFICDINAISVQLFVGLSIKTGVFFHKNIAKGTTDPGVDCINQPFDLIWWVGFGMFGSVGLLGEVLFGLVGLVW